MPLRCRRRVSSAPRSWPKRAALAEGSRHGTFHPLAQTLAPAYAAAQAHYDWIGTAAALLLAFAGGAFAFSRVRPGFAARTRIERLVMLVLLAASLIAILTTLGIVAVAAVRIAALLPCRADHRLPVRHALEPAGRSTPADPGASLGAVPLFWGTFFIGAVIAMIVAIPFGLMSAIYLTQYAAPRTRRWMKPILEMLAGVPTVVYGYFAALTVAPAVRDLAVSARHCQRQLGKRARRRARDGRDDHPVRLVDGGRFARRGAATRCATAAWRWARPRPRRSAGC